MLLYSILLLNKPLNYYSFSNLGSNCVSVPFDYVGSIEYRNFYNHIGAKQIFQLLSKL